jgi:hypothetical protein
VYNSPEDFTNRQPLQVTHVERTRALSSTFALILIALLAACSSSSDTADGGIGGDTGGGGGGGCTVISDCGDMDPHKSVCLEGACQALGGDQKPLMLNIGFTYASEIRDSVSWFTYYALYPEAVDGSALDCPAMLNGRDPEGADLNLIQKYRKQLIVSGDMMQTGTLSLPYMTGMVLFVRVMDENQTVVGLACTPDVAVPGPDSGVGVTLCPADKVDRCLNLLPK